MHTSLCHGPLQQPAHQGAQAISGLSPVLIHLHFSFAPAIRTFLNLSRTSRFTPHASHPPVRTRPSQPARSHQATRVIGERWLRLDGIAKAIDAGGAPGATGGGAAVRTRDEL